MTTAGLEVLAGRLGPHKGQHPVDLSSGQLHFCELSDRRLHLWLSGDTAPNALPRGLGRCCQHESCISAKPLCHLIDPCVTRGHSGGALSLLQERAINPHTLGRLPLRQALLQPRSPNHLTDLHGNLSLCIRSSRHRPTTGLFGRYHEAPGIQAPGC